MTNPPFKVKAVYDYSSPHEDDLSFSNGQIITVTEVEDDDWYVGEYADASGLKKDGLFPRNFVETYEPEPPPRPTRGARARNNETARDTKNKDDREDIAESGTGMGQDEASEIEPKHPNPAPLQAVQTAAVASEQPELQEEIPAKTLGSPPPAPKPAPAVPATTKGPPPAVAEKPSSFRDRIAAFNKPAAPPIPPLKSTNTPTGFIKKPFVAPPPSRNAYIPPQKENPPPRPIVREDIPVNSQAKPDEQLRQESQDSIGINSEAGQEEEAPKTTSLKERIALLQKQQLEQAARRADQAHTEKSKKPSKKPTDSSEKSGGYDEDAPEFDKLRTSEDSSKLYTQQVVESPSAQDGAGDRKLEIRDRDTHNDGYNADQSGAGESAEDVTGNSTSVEDDDRRDAEAQQTKENADPPANDMESSGEEEDDIDPETKRRMELRERMAKMSGGMGMPGMFNPFGGTAMGGIPPKKKTSEKTTEKSETQASDLPQEPRPVPMVPFPVKSRNPSTSAEPGLSNMGSDNEKLTQISTDYNPSDDLRSDDNNQDEHQRGDDDREEYQGTPVTPSRPSTSRDPPPIPTMPHPSYEAQPTSSAPEMFHSPNAGSDSDDEMSTHTKSMMRHDPIATSRDATLAEKLPVAEDAQSPSSPEISSIPDSSHSSEFYQKRRSRPPPIPRTDSGAEVTTQSNNRRPPPPPPPPSQGNTLPAVPPLSRQPTSDVMTSNTMARKSLENEASRHYYDNRQEAPKLSHKGSPEFRGYKHESMDAESTIPSPSVMANKQEKTSTSHRVAPPPLPGQVGRKSVELSRAPPSLPPPIPSTAAPPLPYGINRQYSSDQNSLTQKSPSQNVHTPRQEFNEEELYASSPIRRSTDKSGFSHAKSPIQPSSSHLAIGQSSPRPSNEFSQMYGGIGRKSMDHSRNLNEQEFIASDVDLGVSSKWWVHSKGLPPVFRDRNDILYEIEEPMASVKNTSIVSRSLYILFRDYSQTIISVEFDARNVQDARLEQRHEQPPPRLREDQLEEAHSKIGLRLSDAVINKQNTIVGDGSPQALILDLLHTMPSVLKPVGTRAYGALVYSNRANATVEQHDEIRAGDIVTLRNAKLQGKHGPMHQKYSIEVGKPDHVGVVVDWDGTKKKIRAWEQGRESKKVKIESYKIGDLKIGEVRVWRLMSRSWVGWGSNS